MILDILTKLYLLLSIHTNLARFLGVQFVCLNNLVRFSQIPFLQSWFYFKYKFIFNENNNNEFDK